MRPFTTAIPLARHRRTRLATASLLSATLLLAFSAGTAQAHHGFDDFDTDRLYYIAGTVSQVRWGEPHSYFTVTVENDLPDDTPEHDLPDGLRDPADSDPINAAPSYGGSHDDLAVTIAPPSFTLMWGLDRELDDGERVEAGPDYLARRAHTSGGHPMYLHLLAPGMPGGGGGGAPPPPPRPPRAWPNGRA
ncbi:DUF6152 family protein [Streptomyces bacillaris]